MFNLNDQVLYAFHLDLNQDGKADDLHIEFRFKIEIRINNRVGGLNFKDVPDAYAGVPPIAALSGAGLEGLGLRQRYSVRGVAHTPAGRAVAQVMSAAGGAPLIAVPRTLARRRCPTIPP